MGKKIFSETGQVLEMDIRVKDIYTSHMSAVIFWVEYDKNNNIIFEYDEFYNLHASFRYDNNGEMISSVYNDRKKKRLIHTTTKVINDTCRYFKKYYNEDNKEIIISETLHGYINDNIFRTTTKYSNGVIYNIKNYINKNGEIVKSEHRPIINGRNYKTDISYMYDKDNGHKSIKEVINDGDIIRVYQSEYDKKGNKIRGNVIEYFQDHIVICRYYEYDVNHNEIYSKTKHGRNIITDRIYDYYYDLRVVTDYKYNSKNKLISTITYCKKL